MRLLNVKSRKLEQFQGNNIPDYAILSHCWGKLEEEVTFQELITCGSDVFKKGYAKIDRCCMEASKDGYSYCWIDTCCIDKSSSAELSEAINSMYQWYKSSSICYAYLHDVEGSKSMWSQWYKRGWTLQELIAPPQVRFYDMNWDQIGTRDKLNNLISKYTGIRPAALQGSFSPSSYSVAEKMTWAAGRETTQKEDMAYCLLGLFDVNMPLLYGEGQKSFFRLQEQILKQSSDLSILAWDQIPITCPTPLAPGPHVYMSSSSEKHGGRQKFITPLKAVHPSGHTCIDPPTLTPNGLTITLCLIPYSFRTFLAPVCSISPETTYIDNSANLLNDTQSIILQRSKEDGFYRRVYLHKDALVQTGVHCPEREYRLQKIVIASSAEGMLTPSDYHLHPDPPTAYGFEFDVLEDRAICAIQAAWKAHKRHLGACLIACNPQTASDWISIHSGFSGIAGILSFSQKGPAMVFCFDFDFSPFCLLLTPDQSSVSLGIFRWRITIPTLRNESFCFGNHKDMFSLAAMLRSRGAPDNRGPQSIKYGNTHMFWTEWRDLKAEFQIQGDVVMRFTSTSHGFKVSLISGKCAAKQQSGPSATNITRKRAWKLRKIVQQPVEPHATSVVLPYRRSAYKLMA